MYYMHGRLCASLRARERRRGCNAGVSCKAHLLFKRCGNGVCGVFLSRVEDEATLAGLLHLIHAAVFTLQNTHTHTRSGVAVEAQQECWQLDCLTNDFSPASCPILSLSFSQPGVAHANSDAHSKSAVCHSQIEAYPAKLFTCTFKIRQLSVSVAKPVNVCTPVLTHQQIRAAWQQQERKNSLTEMYLELINGPLPNQS